LALPLSRVISGRATSTITRIGAATSWAVRNGAAIARFLGTSSPTTMENAVASSRATATDTGGTQRSGSPTAPSGPTRSEATLGSTR